MDMSNFILEILQMTKKSVSTNALQNIA